MIFLDNASTTKISNLALQTYNQYSTDKYFNPSALYMKGASIQKELENARQTILSIINADKFDNIIFTSGATEANNMVLNSFIKYKNKTALIGISEHPSVYNVAKNLLDNGYNVKFVGLNDNGTIDINDFKSKLTDDVNFVSIMHVNNETGAINPISEINSIIREKNQKIIFHSDGVQAFGKIDVDVDELGVDLYTISSHKIFGPKGVGALYIKKGVNINPLMIGGGQEMNLRSGTENTPGIFSFVTACKIASDNLHDNYNSAVKKAHYIKDNLELIDNIRINSDNNCSPYIISFSLPHLRAETILRMLEQKDIIIGNGSACSSHKKGNRILSNMGVEQEYIEGALRVSINHDTSTDDIDNFIKELKLAINEYKKNTNR
ncbi:MAG: cysteine desulfurase [Clostridiales bacterium]|nr:cysteine desulfurase [Clostridiales bacterium]